MVVDGHGGEIHNLTNKSQRESLTPQPNHGLAVILSDSLTDLAEREHGVGFLTTLWLSLGYALSMQFKSLSKETSCTFHLIQKV